jgi:hypothetical protein
VAERTGCAENLDVVDPGARPYPLRYPLAIDARHLRQALRRFTDNLRLP